MSDWSLYDRGFSVFPLAPQSKRPLEDWEAFQECRASPERVAAWSRQPSNIGIATGAVSGIVVLDCDGLIARVEAESRGLPPTLTVATPRGTHFYFQHPGWNVPNRAGPKWCGWDQMGLDLRGDGGYVVGPGSYYVPTADERAKGKVEGPYRIELDAPVAPAPDWLLALIFPREHKPNVPPKVADETSAYGRAALHREIEILTGAAPGGVNQQVNDSAFAIGQLVAGGEITSAEAWGALQEALAVMGIDCEEKAQGTLQRGWDAGMEAPRGVEHVEAPSMVERLGVRDGEAPPPPAVEVGPVAKIRQFIRGSTLWHEDMSEFFENCWYVEQREGVFVKGRGVLSPTSFDTLKGGFQFPTDVEGKSKTRSAWDAFRLSPSWSCPIVYDVCFRPDKEPGGVIDIEGRPFVNTYEPIKTKRVLGDPSRFVDFLRKLLPVPRDYDILTSYMFALVQNPGRKFQWWPVLQGVKGNGKTMILTALAHAVGQRYTHLVNPEAMGKTGNQFNSWVQGNLLVGIEEIFVSDQRHILETFKPIVTNRRTALEGKGKDQTTGDNFCNGVMLTNHRDGVPVSDDERRYSIFWTAQQTVDDLTRDGMDGGYFPDLYDWLHGRGEYQSLGVDFGLSVVNEWLQTSEPVAAFNPAGLCQRAPDTSSTADAITESLGTLEQEVREAIDGDEIGFRGGLITSSAVRSLFDRLRKSVAPKRVAGIMKAIGYHKHPLLTAQRGRPNNPLSNGTKPVLYFDLDSPLLKMARIEDVIAGVEEIIKTGQPANSNVVPIRR